MSSKKEKTTKVKLTIQPQKNKTDEKLKHLMKVELTEYIAFHFSLQLNSDQQNMSSQQKKRKLNTENEAKDNETNVEEANENQE